MADFSILSALIAGIQRNIDLTTNTLVMSSLKLGTSELTKAKLDLLAITVDSSSAVDASAQHHHDGRYFTESEIGSTADGSAGASLVGVDQTPAFSNISGASVQAILESIDTALGTAGGDTFLDNVFRIQDNTTPTKQIAFEAVGITAATTRTITMPDTDVDLGDIATNTAHSSGDGSDHQDVADLATLSGVAANSVNLGTFSGAVIPDSSTIKAALQSLETKTENNASLINNFEWQASALSYVVDNTAAPATEVSGNRYVLSHDGGAPHANYDGASAGDIVEFNGTSWVATTPTIGTFVSVDDNQTIVYQWGGAAWADKAFEATTASTGLTKVGFDIRLADATAANGIVVSSGAISVSLATDPGLEFNAGGLRVLVDPSGALERVAAGLDVKNGSIDTDRLGALAVTNAKVAAAAGINFSKMEALTANKVAETNGSGVVVAGSVDAADIDTLTDGSNADALHKHAALKEDFVAGETLTAGVRALRFARDAETAGRVYLAEKTPSLNDGTDDKFHVIGLVVAAGELAAAAINNVVKAGPITVTAHGFTVGRPVYLTDANGGLTSTAPTAAGDAVVKVGMVKDANTIEVQVQVMGVN